MRQYYYKETQTTAPTEAQKNPETVDITGKSRSHKGYGIRLKMEQGTGVEPAYPAWEAGVIPIYQPCRL